MDTCDKGGIPNQGGEDNLRRVGIRKVGKNQSGSLPHPHTKVFSS